MPSLKMLLMATIAVTAIAASNNVVAGEDASDTEIVVRGTKRIKPTDAPPPLELYAKPPQIRQIALSPDGSRVAFVTRADGMQILAGYHFSDHQHVYYKMVGSDISAIYWADEDHVLISDSRLATRGTCEGGISNIGHQSYSARDLSGAQATAGATGAALQDQMQQLLNTNQPPRCTYFGIRSENTLTSVNMLTGNGTPIGAHIGDAPSQALGFPFRTVTGGRTQLVGPFLEMRAQSSGSQPAQRAFLWKVDLETGHGQLVDDGGGDIERETRYVDDWLIDHDGTIVARSLYDFLKESYRIELRDNGKWKPVLTREIIRADHTFAPFLIGIAGDGKSIVVLDTDTHGKDLKGSSRQFHYYKLDANGVFSNPLENSDAGQERPVFDPRSGRLAGFATQDEQPKYDIRDSVLREVYDKALAAAPGHTVEVLSITDDAHKVLIRVTGSEDTGSYYLLDFVTGVSTTIGEDFPQVPTNWIASQEVFTYEAPDGTNIDGILTLPPKAINKRLPLVVLPHDGPGGHDSLGFNWLSQALASRGYLVFQPNYRGSYGRGNDFVSAGNGQWDGKILSDIKAGVEALVQQGLVDPHRVCTVGIGYGGYAALKAAEGGETRCAVSIDGISDIARYQNWRKASAAQPDPDAFASLSPSPTWPRTFLKDPTSTRSVEMYIGSGASDISTSAIAGPILLIHQDGDALVPVSQSRDLRDKLTAADKHVEYLEIEGDNHVPETEEIRLKILQTVTAFLALNNPAEN